MGHMAQHRREEPWLKTLMARNGYNGTVLWSLEIPDLERFNMPRDCSNWCADPRFVYVAIRNKCWQIDATNGHVVRLHDVDPAAAKGWQNDWDTWQASKTRSSAVRISAWRPLRTRASASTR